MGCQCAANALPAAAAAALVKAAEAAALPCSFRNGSRRSKSLGGGVHFFEHTKTHRKAVQPTRVDCCKNILKNDTRNPGVVTRDTSIRGVPKPSIQGGNMWIEDCKIARLMIEY